MATSAEHSFDFAPSSFHQSPGTIGSGFRTFSWEANNSHRFHPSRPYSPHYRPSTPPHLSLSLPSKRTLSPKREPSSDLKLGPVSIFAGYREEHSRTDSIDSDKKGQQAALPMSFRKNSDFEDTPLSTNKPMPHRVDSLPLPSMRHADQRYDHSHHPPSPPPIATLSRSPSLSSSSLDRSSVSTPPRRSSNAHDLMYPGSVYSHSHTQGRLMHQPPSRSAHHDEYHSRASSGVNTQYSHGPHPLYEHRYSSHESSAYSTSSSYPNSPPSVSSMTHTPTGTLRSIYSPPMYSLPGPGNLPGLANLPGPGNITGPGNSSVIHTDDAATKLSDRVRRRCFNCCTSDTSTWRRSNLSPGKVLCNKCGLFERTHSRPRPDQFPHKRGPLAASALRSKTPPSSSQPPPPPSYSHQSYHTIPPLSSIPDQRRSFNQTQLPEIQSWLHEPATSGSARPPSPKTPQQSSPHRKPASPPLPSAASTHDSRD